MSGSNSDKKGQELLERIRGGDAEAFAQYAELKRRPLLSFIERKLSDSLKRKVEPQDIVQEVVLGAASSFEEMDFADRDVFGWLCQLAQRRIVDAHRRYFGAQKRTAGKEVGLYSLPGGDADRGGLIDLLVASITSPSQAFSREQREFRMRAALEDLSPEAREALRMRYVDGLPSKEIAQRLGKTDAAVRVLLSRSLSRLQKMLSQDTLFKSFAKKGTKKPRGS